MPPKFASVVMGTMIGVKKNESFALQCPAQAFPVPAFRYFSNLIKSIILEVYLRCEAKFAVSFCYRTYGKSISKISKSRKKSIV